MFPISTKTSTKKSFRLSPAVIAAGIAAIIVVAAIILYFAMVAPALNCDTVYPNVHVGDIDVGGLTPEEATAKLIANGIGVPSVPSVKVNFPRNVSIDIDVLEVGAIRSAESMAKAAYEYGRSGSFIDKVLTYNKSLKNVHALSFPQITQLNESAIRALIEPAVEEVNSAFLGERCVVTASSVSLLKTADDITLSAEETFQSVRAALLIQDFSDIDILPKSGGGSGEVDIDALFAQMHKDAVDAVYDPESGEIRPSSTGLTFDLALAKNRYAGAAYGDVITIPLKVLHPEVTENDISALHYRDVLAEITTTLTAVANRSNNVKLSCKAVNGTILKPGEMFSYNDALGERTAAAGYLPATAYAGGKEVLQYGGGICQLSSMIYYCAVTANLEIDTRTNHLWMPSYVPPGMDATVSWGGPEFKFVNNTAYPIKIETEIDMDATYPSTVTVRLLGTNITGSYAKFTYNIVGTVEPQEIRTEDPTLAPGEERVDAEGSVGYIVDTYRTVYNADGSIISSTYESRSHYAAHDREVAFGPTPSEGEGPSVPVEGETPVGPTQPTDPAIPAEPQTPSEGETSTDPETPSDSSDPIESEGGDVPSDPEGESPVSPEAEA